MGDVLKVNRTGQILDCQLLLPSILLEFNQIGVALAALSGHVQQLTLHDSVVFLNRHSSRFFDSVASTRREMLSPKINSLICQHGNVENVGKSP